MPLKIDIVTKRNPIFSDTYFSGDITSYSKLKGPYWNLDFLFTNYFSLNFVKANTQSSFSIGVNLLSLVIHYRNNLQSPAGFYTSDPNATNPSYPINSFTSLKSSQKQHLFASGPVMKFSTEFDLIKPSKVHGFRFFADTKGTLSYASFRADGSASLAFSAVDRDNMGNLVYSNNSAKVDYKKQKVHLILVNYMADVGFRYDYKKFISVWVSGKVKTLITSCLLSTSMGGNDGGSSLGTISIFNITQGVVPDLTNLAVAIPYSLGFAGIDAGMSFAF